MTQPIRKIAPEPLPPVEFNIPGVFKTTLDNGLKVVVVQDGRLPLISYRLAFNWGDINDPEGVTGVSSALASMQACPIRRDSSRLGKPPMR